MIALIEKFAFFYSLFLFGPLAPFSLPLLCAKITFLLIANNYIEISYATNLDQQHNREIVISISGLGRNMAPQMAS